MLFEKVTFPNADGTSLAARFDRPPAPPRAVVLFAHCFTCSKDLKAVGAISRTLVEEGFAVLRFDFTGLGESAGDFADTTFSSNIEDLVAAADFLADAYAAPQLLIGHSLGGAAVLRAAHQIPSVEAVATIGAPYDPEHIKHLLTEELDTIAAEGAAEVTLAGRPFTIKKKFLDDLARQSTDDVVRTLDRPLLLFHSPVDQTVGIENARMIYDAAKHPKSFVSLDQASHLLTDPADAAFVGRVLSAWGARHIDTSTSDRDGEDAASHGTHIVARTPAEGFRTDVVAGAHRFTADEPESVGGTDTGPTPYDLLAAALGTCTSMTLRMYADRKDWPLEEAVVAVTHEKIHAEDCEECATEEGKIDRLTRSIQVEGALDAEQRGRLLEIANKCPVHRTLTSEINVVSHLIDE
ncbi:bifunctional alpha/beta hydrolase/OsmC family protein [Salisaeta longa]|uniref:bifunctional alpha/beta hydrolase/OsmC family protein n=1 Tax=Salisaeta longa TaxID=503170 RepID=UPI0003B332B0|nr:bifunctional alpha/beta hydrolase/OsmC family protein [Salisaeta longa]